MKNRKNLVEPQIESYTINPRFDFSEVSDMYYLLKQENMKMN